MNDSPRPRYVIDRNSPFWIGCFQIALEALCRRDPEAILQGAKFAAIARDLADDCDRARQDVEHSARCAQCAGVGCAVCRFTGRADPGEGLRPVVLSDEQIAERLSPKGFASAHLFTEGDRVGSLPLSEKPQS